MPMNREDETRNLCSCFLCNFKELEEPIFKNPAFMASRAVSYFGGRKRKSVLRHHNVGGPIHSQITVARKITYLKRKSTNRFFQFFSSVNICSFQGHEGVVRSDLHGCRSGKVSGVIRGTHSEAASGERAERVGEEEEEVDEPDLVARQADRLISKSVFRRVALTEISHRHYVEPLATVTCQVFD